MENQIDPETLTVYTDAAAGQYVTAHLPEPPTNLDFHSEGVLSDPAGDLVVKPCTPSEVAFYEIANASHPELAYFLPRFLGTLKYGTPAPATPPAAADASSSATTVSDIPNVINLKALNLPLAHSPSTSVPPPDSPKITDLKALNLPLAHAPSSSVPPSGTASSFGLYEPGPLRGKRLDTDLHIVLDNIAGSFLHPNILDLKLGSRLWADNADARKRARLDYVSTATTSGSMGFRMAGMRVWQGQDQVTDEASVAELETVNKDGKPLISVEEKANVRVFNKFWGRTFTADDVVDGFRRYFIIPSSGMDKTKALPIARQLLGDVKQIQTVLENEETRMYSASILLVYEGDPVGWKEAMDTAASKPERSARAVDEEEEDEEEEDMDDEEVEEKRAWAVKLIDFAHGTFTPGLGPDENVLQGVRSIVKILEQLEAEFAA
jgi:1D-myo-inositol-tetrakisphosphate 5-kinase/inositol-polyphosphate multikinase